MGTIPIYKDIRAIRATTEMNMQSDTILKFLADSLRYLAR